MRDVIVPSDDQPDEWLTLDDFCARLKIAKTTARTWRRRGFGPRAYLLVGQLRYRLSEVEQWERDLMAAQGGGAA